MYQLLQAQHALRYAPGEKVSLVKRITMNRK